MATYVKANCLCGLNSFNLEFRTESLPLSSVICHCNTCRHCTGQLYRNYAPFIGEPISVSSDQPADFQHLSPYKSSSPTKRWFCSTCSAHMFAQSTEVAGWYVAVGALEKSDGIVKSVGHVWVSDTLDGGIADYLSVIDGFQLPRYPAFEGTVLPVGWRSADIDEALNQNELSARCHCGSVRFSITRPSAASASPIAPYPSFLFPPGSTPHVDEKWWLRPAGSEKPTHYLACHCACRSCRLVSGSEIQSLAFIPRVNIIVRKDASAPPVTLDLQDEGNRLDGLRQYESSPGRFRESCGTCGANVFLWNKKMPDFLVVSTGIFDQRKGARCEGWLEWFKERITFSEDAVRKKFVEEFGHGLRGSA